MHENPLGHTAIQIKAIAHGKYSGQGIMKANCMLIEHICNGGSSLWLFTSPVLIIVWSRGSVHAFFSSHDNSLECNIVSVLKSPIFLLLIQKLVFYLQNTIKLQWLEKTECNSILNYIFGRREITLSNYYQSL